MESNEPIEVEEPEVVAECAWCDSKIVQGEPAYRIAALDVWCCSDRCARKHIVLSMWDIATETIADFD